MATMSKLTIILQVFVLLLSMIIGIALLLTSSWFLDDWREINEKECMNMEIQSYGPYNNNYFVGSTNVDMGYYYGSNSNNNNNNGNDNNSWWFKSNDKCTSVTLFIISSSFGIAAGIIQILSLPIGLIQQWKLWSCFQFFVFLFSMTGFAIGFDGNAHYLSFMDSNLGERGNSFLAISGLDFIWAFTVIWIGIFVFNKSSSNASGGGGGNNNQSICKQSSEQGE